MLGGKVGCHSCYIRLFWVGRGRGGEEVNSLLFGKRSEKHTEENSLFHLCSCSGFTGPRRPGSEIKVERRKLENNPDNNSRN